MKAVIPAAGRGTRLLPYTRAQPKEMIPVVDKPAIQFVVEEAVASGLRDILIVTSPGKKAIENYFDVGSNREEELGLYATLKPLREFVALVRSCRIHYVVQREPKGLADAILNAESFVGDGTFAVLLGDDITMDSIPCTKQLRMVHERQGVSVVAVQRVPSSSLSQYGVVAGEEIESGLFRVKDIIEKPSPDRAPSNLATIGRYVLTSTIFDEIRNLVPGVNDELQLTDGLQSLLRREDLYAWVYDGRRYDIGDRVGWVMAMVELALEREDCRDRLEAFLMEQVERLRRVQESATLPLG